MEAENTQSGKVCPGDCLQCSRPQQLYCSSQGNLEIHRMLEILTGRVNNLTEKVDKLSQVVLASEVSPTPVVKKGKAPKSSGADN